jgi:hypothetical protein
LAWDTITPYHRGFREFSQAFEAFGFEDIHKGSLPFLPARPGAGMAKSEIRIGAERHRVGAAMSARAGGC